MAQNIEINVKKANDLYEVLYPKTKSNITDFNNLGSTLTSTSVEGALKELDSNKAEKSNIDSISNKISNLENNKAEKSEVLLLKNIKTAIFDVIYPIGSIYLSYDSTNPSSRLGGTWELTAQGRTFIGVDSTQEEFNTAKKTGGEKTHTLTPDELPLIRKYAGDFSIDRGEYNQTVNTHFDTGKTASKSAITSASVGKNQPHNNLQPYITVYKWVRTN